MATRSTLLATAAAALVLGAAGCGDSGTTTLTTPATSSIDDPSVAKSAGGDGSLALGRAAIVPYVDYGTPNQSKKTKVGVRVHEVRKGRIADFKGFDLEPAQRRATPYYVDATFENRGGFALSRNLLRASLEDAGRPRVPPDHTGRARRQLPPLPAGRAVGPAVRAAASTAARSCCSRRTPGPAACASRAT